MRYVHDAVNLEHLSEDPYGKGWFIKIKIADEYFNFPKSSDKDRAKYRAMIEAFRITQRKADPLK